MAVKIPAAFLLKSDREYLYLCILRIIFCTVQLTSTTKQNMRSGQNTSISIALNMVHMMPRMKANVILSQIWDSLIEETNGFYDSTLFSNSNSKPQSPNNDTPADSIINQSLMASQCSSVSSSSSPLGVIQLTSNCSKQNPIKQVITSQLRPTARQRYTAASTNVKNQRSLRWWIVRLTKLQYRRRTQLNPLLASIFNSLKLQVVHILLLFYALFVSSLTFIWPLLYFIPDWHFLTPFPF